MARRDIRFIDRTINVPWQLSYMNVPFFSSSLAFVCACSYMRARDRKCKSCSITFVIVIFFQSAPIVICSNRSEDIGLAYRLHMKMRRFEIFSRYGKVMLLSLARYIFNRRWNRINHLFRNL